MTDPVTRSAPSDGRWRRLAYWAFTGLIAYEMVAGSLWDLLRIEYVRAVMAHLGYPLYLLTIIGAWKLPCAVALLVPRLQRLKEWAYAGAFFNYSGAFASHLLAGDAPKAWIGPTVFAAFTLTSWALRPQARRLEPALPAPAARVLDWAVPLGVIAALVVLSLATLPKGPPP